MDSVAALKAAAGHIEDRRSRYENAQGERQMKKTVAAFNALTGHNLSEREAWLFMVCVKAGRAVAGKFDPDHFEDGAAYFALWGEAEARVFGNTVGGQHDETRRAPGRKPAGED